ncbi:MAG: DUF819 family protein [Synergistaceae bacterium]|jgi:uncharacterized membrane protein|nr:DUF819 family protein [Synergistaceae bacterium]
MNTGTWVAPDDTLTLWTFLAGWAAVSVWLEQKYKWASTLTGCMIALLGAMLFSNFGVVPPKASVYEVVWDYAVPFSIPLLLFDADLRRIWKEGGRLFTAFHVAVVGTVLGTFLATFLLWRHIPEARGIAAMFCGTYIGGSINLAAMREVFKVSSELAAASVVADNFLMALYFLVLMFIPTTLFRASPKAWKTSSSRVTLWERKEISLPDIAGSVAAALFIVTVSAKLAEYLFQSPLPQPIRIFLGQKYLMITTVTLFAATLFPKFFSGLRGAREIGTFFVYVFFVVIGAPASFSVIWRESPLLFAYAAIIIFVNMLMTLGLGSLFRLAPEELLIACNATVGGPTTAAAMAIAKGWGDLAAPAMLVGVWGYVIGNYAAVATANYLGALLDFP